MSYSEIKATWEWSGTNYYFTDTGRRVITDGSSGVVDVQWPDGHEEADLPVKIVRRLVNDFEIGVIHDTVLLVVVDHRGVKVDVPIQALKVRNLRFLHEDRP